MLDTIIHRIYDRVRSSDIGTRMASGAFWSFTGTAVAKLIVLVSGIICARILTKEQYGQLGIVRSTISMFVVVGSAGLGTAAAKFISEYLRNAKDRISSIYILTNGFAFITGVLVTVIILTVAPVLAEKTLQCPELVNSIRVGALLLFVTVLNGAQNGTLSGFEDFKSISINTFWGSISESLCMIIGAYFYGVTGAITGYGTGYIVLYICNFCSIRKNFKVFGISFSKKSFNRRDISLLYTFCLPSMLSALMVTPTYWVVRTFLVSSSGFGELAAYEAAEQWRAIILFVPAAISNIVLPILSSLNGKEQSRYTKVLKLSLLLNMSIALMLSLLVIISSKYIMGAYGDEYVANRATLIILSLSTVFQSAANVVGISISSRAKVWEGFGFNCLWAVMLLLLSRVFLSYGYGSAGVSAAILISYIIHTILQILFLYRSLNVND